VAGAQCDSGGPAAGAEPAHSERGVGPASPPTDIHLATFGRALAALVRDAAPGVRLRFEHNTPHIVHRAAEHLRTVDGMLLANVPAIDLYDDRWVCVVSSDTVTSEPPA